MNSLMHMKYQIQSENGNEFENLWKCFNVLIKRGINKVEEQLDIRISM